jgi:hypothetical protein
MNSPVFLVGDRVQHIDPRVKWQVATVISTPETSTWDCVPGTVRVSREGIDEAGQGIMIPVHLLQLVGEEPDF